MSKGGKLLERLLRIPKDFTWDELTTVLANLGYEPLKSGKTGGSRRKFVDQDRNIINLHKPHPGNIVKEYALKQVVDQLKEQGKI